MSAVRILDCHRLELDGIRYVILRESIFDQLCLKAGVARTESKTSEEHLAPAFDIDRTTLTEKLRHRRRAAGLSQAELARRAGVRAETLNRIERGHTEPDFTTIRKLVLAMNAAERIQAESRLPKIQESDAPTRDGEIVA
jgi:DNA-binding XRE family transcriptional regulator